jgi:hypothetical protein
MSNDSIIAELEEQMASAAFNQLVEQHLGSMELTVLLAARLNNVPLMSSSVTGCYHWQIPHQRMP